MTAIYVFISLFLLSIPFIVSLHHENLKTVDNQFSNDARQHLHNALNINYLTGKTISLALANNGIIQRSLAFEERQPIIDQINKIPSVYQTNTNLENLSIHIITADGRSLVKTYNLESFNQDVSNHPLIMESVTLKASSHGIYIGGAEQYYRTITVQPVYNPESSTEIIGYIALSLDLSSITKHLRDSNIDYAFFSAMPKKNSNNHSFKIDNANYFADSSLKGITFSTKDVLANQILHTKTQLVRFDPVLDFNSNLIGTHVTSIPVTSYKNQAWQLSETVGLTLLVIFLSVLFMVTSFVYLIRTNVIKPIEGLEQTVKKIIDSNDFNQSIEIHSEDEIGRMSRNFEHLLQKTHESIVFLKNQQSFINQGLIVSEADTYGNITNVNDNFCHISGYRKEELIGNPHNIIRHPDTPKEVFKDLWETIQNGHLWSGEIKNRHKSGSEYYVRSHIFPVFGSYKNITGYIAIREDITAQKKLEKSLSKAKEKAEAANTAKSEFLSSMSHELRTPLNAIIGFSQLLEYSPNLPEKDLQFATNIHKAGQHLLELINQVLELATIEAGKLQLSIEPIDAMLAIKDSVTTIRPIAEKRKISIIEPNSDSISYKINADLTRLKQILFNLTSNAIKYNHEGGEVKIKVEHIEEQNELKISVIDNGYGIPAQLQHKVFATFERLGKEGSPIEGTGVGLSLTRDIVHAMNGEIGFNSIENKGSTFWFTLPTSKTQLPTAPMDVSINSQEDNKTTDNTITVLCIEDNPTNILLMEAFFSNLKGVVLQISENGLDGIEQAKKLLPDVILIDINLPDMSGYDVLLELKHNANIQEKGSVLCALTANAMKEDSDRGKSAGFAHYFTKPINIKELTGFITDIQKKKAND